jgi:hypothetical protein
MFRMALHKSPMGYRVLKHRAFSYALCLKRRLKVWQLPPCGVHFLTLIVSGLNLPGAAIDLFCSRLCAPRAAGFCGPVASSLGRFSFPGFASSIAGIGECGRRFGFGVMS